MPKTRTAAGVKVSVTAPLLPVAIATGRFDAAALCIAAAALQTIADEEKTHGDPAAQA
jgi:hypothetical protein